MKTKELKVALLVEKEKWSRKPYAELVQLDAVPSTTYECGEGAGRYWVKVVVLQADRGFVHLSIELSSEDGWSCFFPVYDDIVVHQDGRVEA